MVPLAASEEVAPFDRRKSFLSGGGEMGKLIRAIDWSKTPLGPVDAWSQTLRTMVSFLLANRFPLLLWWGPQYISIYNDAYRPILGAKHPRSMGQPVSECWSEIWHILKPLIDKPFFGGPATWMEDIPLEINRHGFTEETHFTIAYSPVPDETAPGGIGGVLATVHEITEKIVAERRVHILRDLGARAADARSAEEACAIAASVLADHAKDIPFVLLYLVDANSKEAHLAGAAGVQPGEPASPRSIRLDASGSKTGWPVKQVFDRQEILAVENLADRFRRIPLGPWSDPPDSAAIVPVRSTKADELAGLLVAGVSPRLRLDHLYRSFLELMAAQVATSIANARAYEEERKRAQALAQIDRAKTAFFSNVSHEFRTPLTLMLGPLGDALDAPAQVLRADDLAMVHRNGLRLLRLVNTLLDFSRIEAGRLQASYEPVDLPSFTAELASEFRAATEKAGLNFIIDCPCFSTPVWIDRDMWEKIVLNLVSNAFKFTLQGTITVQVRERDGRAVLSVVDTGIGIPAKELPKLFDRFHRIEGAHGRTHEGTGIGLALVQELTKLHGGAVNVASTVGLGSSFSVSVPFGTAHLPADRLRAKRTLAPTTTGAQPYVEEALRWLPGATAETSAPAQAEWSFLPEHSAHAPFGGARASVLVVDDNADMREYVRRLLAPHYEVRTAADGVEALAAMRAQPPDLLLSDVMMPRLDGIGLLRQVRDDPVLARFPVVLLSARAGEEASIEGLEAGADDYLIKPFAARELLARVSANLKLGKLRREFTQRLAADVHALSRLQEVGNRCLRKEASLDECLATILETAIELSGADKGNIQLLKPDSEALVIKVHRGFEAPFLEFFAEVDAHEASACGVAMACGRRIVVEDVASSEIFAGQPSHEALLAAGVRAVYSTPLLSSSGKPMGMISVHFAAPHRPGEKELRYMDLLARQAGDYLERKRGEEIAKTLMHEVQHRSNNLLAVIQSIAKRSLSGGRSLDEARDAFEARLHALARANKQLTNANWSGAKLNDIVRLELEPFAERAKVTGADILLRPQQAQNFCLALHELVTNAAKYGALSKSGGTLDLSWKVASNGKGRVLQFNWRERGGPPVRTPTRRGFGTSLISAVFSDVHLDFATEGLRCEIGIPLTRTENLAQ
jgi:signal transduction histidine kinase/DNA-binding response OmpR family regulator